jgi:hypothetical protein
VFDGVDPSLLNLAEAATGSVVINTPDAVAIPIEAAIASGPDVPSPRFEIREREDRESRRIFIMCGNSRFGGKVDRFVSQVPRCLRPNLSAGDVFVWANDSRHQIAVLQRSDDGLMLTFRRSDYERYPWPRFEVACAVEVSSDDFKTLLNHPQFMQRLKGKLRDVSMPIEVT